MEQTVDQTLAMNELLASLRRVKKQSSTSLLD